MNGIAEPERRSRGWILPLALAPFVLVLLAKFITWQEAPLRAVAPGCVFHDMTGLHCPGCGATRAVFAMAKGDVHTAWTMNPALWVGLGIALYFLLIFILGRIPGSGIREKPWAKLSVGMGWMLVAALLLFGILRNLPWWPFTLLAPH